MYVVAAHLNVRAAATFRSSIVTTVDTGYKVTVLESANNGWKKVLLQNGEIGYVNGRYLTDVAPYFEKALGSTYTVATPQAFLRGDGLKTKVAVLKRGDTLQVMDEKVFLGKWLRVKVINATSNRYNERVGYISKKLVQVNEATMYSVESVMNSAPAESGDWITDGSEAVELNSAPATESTPVEEVSTTSPETVTETASGSGTEDSEDSASIESLLGGLLK